MPARPIRPHARALAQDRPSLAWLAAEVAGLFFALPLLVRAGALPGPRLLVLAVVTAGAAWVLLSLPAGLGLPWRYHRTGAIGPVRVEHAVYGLLLFTLGLGGFFYDGRG